MGTVNRIAHYFERESLVDRQPRSRVSSCELCGADYGAGAFRHDGHALCRSCKMELLRAVWEMPEPDVEQYEDFDGRGVIAFMGISVLAGVGLVLMVLAVWG